MGYLGRAIRSSRFFIAVHGLIVMRNYYQFMPRNDLLRQARAARKDEFYTQYVDIQLEVNAYIDNNPNVFRGKTILLPCDDPEWSNFTRYFAQNFDRFGLKKLISTSYAIESKKYKFNK